MTRNLANTHDEWYDSFSNDNVQLYGKTIEYTKEIYIYR